MPKLPFTKEAYNRMLDERLGGQTVSSNSPLERLKQAAMKLKSRLPRA